MLAFRFACTVAILPALLAGPEAGAAPVVVNFSVKGTFTNFGQNNAAFHAAPGNTFVGLSNQAIHRNYFVFDLAGVTDNVTAAHFVVHSPFGSYISPDPTETWTIFDYSSDIAILQNQSSISVPAYNDLGSGTVYGSVVVSESSEAFLVAINLNNDAITNINNTRGNKLALGGAITTINGSSTQVFFAFSTNNDSAQLILNPLLTGDFNGNNQVDAADYVVWRKSTGSAADYDLWRTDFGQSTSSEPVRRSVPPSQNQQVSRST